ncbi:Protein transport protein, partial [Lachnellula hyalina]
LAWTVHTHPQSGIFERPPPPLRLALPLNTLQIQAAKMMFFAFGNLIYSTTPVFPSLLCPTNSTPPVSVLLINAIAVLSEDRFLARVGWSNTVAEPAFGGGSGGAGSESVKNRLIGLMTSVRTLMRIPLIGINVTIILYELALG